MIFTLADARTFCAEFVENGKSPSDSSVLDAINECSQLFMNNERLWQHKVQKLKLSVVNDSIALPRDVEGVLGVCVGYTPRDAQGQMYEFLEGGPGTIVSGSDFASYDLLDLGDGFPTFYEIGDVPLRIAAFSTEASDVGKTIRVRGYNGSFENVAATTPGEVIDIQRWQNGVEGEIDGDNFTLSTNYFQTISSIIKEQTTGYITLLAWNDADGTVSSVEQGHYHIATNMTNGTLQTALNHTHTVTNGVISTYAGDTIVQSHTHTLTRTMNILSKYHPYETQPGYRRYKIAGVSVPTTLKSNTPSLCITLLVKMRYVPLVHEQDVLPIQNLPAYKYMCKSIHKLNEDDFEGAAAYRAAAEAELAAQVAGYHMGNNNPISFRYAGYMKDSADSVI